MVFLHDCVMLVVKLIEIGESLIQRINIYIYICVCVFIARDRLHR